MQDNKDSKKDTTVKYLWGTLISKSIFVYIGITKGY